jgi:hypothetical protein
MQEHIVYRFSKMVTWFYLRNIHNVIHMAFLKIIICVLFYVSSSSFVLYPCPSESKVIYSKVIYSLVL